MDRIEKQVHLPKGASPLADYSRYYSDDGKGEIVAVYLIIPRDEPRPGETCEELTTNFTSRTVPCRPVQLPWAIPAGQRRWLKDKRELPFINDGGCMEVDVTFNKAKWAVTSIQCNGEA
jgi:hypothetical protein